MCGDYEYELDWDTKCDICKKKPAVLLLDPYTGELDGSYRALCEKCGIEVYGEEVVKDWAGTQLYLQTYPEMREVWEDD